MKDQSVRYMDFAPQEIERQITMKVNEYLIELFELFNFLSDNFIDT